MKPVPDKSTREPIGRAMANIGRLFLSELHKNLDTLDIERSFYPLILIEEGKGMLTQQELAQKLACDKVQVVRIIDYLSSRGYVKRVKNSHDRRKYNLEITDIARKSLPEIKKAIQKTTAQATKNIPDKKIDELFKTIQTIEQNLKNKDSE